MGLFLGEPRADDPIDRLVELSGQAVDDGFASLWLPNIFGLDAITALAVIGREVGGDVELGTAVVPTYPRHPMALAQQALTTQIATGGRLTLGIGLSHRLVVESMWGLSYERPVRHMEEYLSVLLPLLRERQVSFGGEVFRVAGSLDVPAGVPNTPVVVAALGDRMLRLSGTVADGTITWMTAAKVVADHIGPKLRAAADEAGRSVRIICALPVCVTDDEAAGRELVGRVFSYYGELPSYRAMLDKQAPGTTPADVAIVGDEAAVRAGIEEVAAAGATDFVAVEVARGEDQERTRALLKTLL